MTVSVMWLFLTVPWVGILWVILFFPDHTHLLFCGWFDNVPNELKPDRI